MARAQRVEKWDDGGSGGILMNYRKQQQKHINCMAHGEDIRESDAGLDCTWLFLWSRLNRSSNQYKGYICMGFPDGSNDKESACNVGGPGTIPGSWRSPWRRERQPTPVFLPGEFHGQRSLVGYSPWGCKESDTTKRLTLSISYIRVYTHRERLLCLESRSFHICCLI